MRRQAFAILPSDAAGQLLETIAQQLEELGECRQYLIQVLHQPDGTIRIESRGME